MEPGKHSTYGKDFYLKEYECLRKEIEWLLAEGRSLERNVVVAVGITWGFLLTKSLTLSVHKWAWFIPCLFSGLGALRATGTVNELNMLHEYVKRIEGSFSTNTDPGGWEHFAEDRRWTAKSTFLFWLALITATLAAASYVLISTWHTASPPPLSR